MTEITKKAFANLIKTDAGEEVLLETLGRENIDKMFEAIMDKTISAQKYYVGNPDGKFITAEEFDEETANTVNASVTINTLLGDDAEERTALSERKKQVPGLISKIGIQKIVNLIVLLFAFAHDGKYVNYETLCVCTPSEISETNGSLRLVQKIVSTTKDAAPKMMQVRNENQNELAICRCKFRQGVVVLDMQRFGENCSNPQEVLILTGNRYSAKKVGNSTEIYSKDGKPAIIYEVEIYEPEDFSWYVELVQEQLKEIVFDDNMLAKVKSFFKELNSNIGGKYPEEPDSYKEWKDAFKMYVYNELKKIYTK